MNMRNMGSVVDVFKLCMRRCVNVGSGDVCFYVGVDININWGVVVLFCIRMILFISIIVVLYFYCGFLGLTS